MFKRNSTSRAAFTLIELLVAIFLMLIVMVGVNTVFTTTGATVGANQAISEISRSSRAVQATLYKDFSCMASDGPSINIRNEQQWSFRNSADAAADVDGVAYTADLTQSGTEPTLQVPFYNARSHRQDRISFFTRQLIRRQTGNDGVYAANQASLEQWVWLGHLRMPDNTPPGSLVDANFQLPGNGSIASNPNNFYAQQWALGRMAMDLIEPTSGTINDQSTPANSQVYVAPNTALGTPALDPLAMNSKTSDAKFKLQESRYDLAGTSVNGYTGLLNSYIQANPANVQPTLPTTAQAWWESMMGGYLMRFRGLQYIPRPLTSFGASQTSPLLAVNVSQFVVEYAGDFVSQDPATGAVTNCYFSSSAAAPSPYANQTNGTDGVIDFVIPSTGLQANNRMIRWYGLPRSITGNATVALTNGDVCPLRDTVQSCVVAGNTPYLTPTPLVAPIEKLGGTGGTNLLQPSATAPGDYATVLSATNGYYYDVAWGPNDTFKPKLIRVVMTLEDPTGRLADGQTFEYTFTLP